MTPVRPFDLIIEYQERPSDRWLVPRGSVHLGDAYASSLGSYYDVVIAIDLPVITSTSMVSESDFMADANTSRKPKQAVKLHWKGLQQETYDILLAWSCGDTVTDTSKKLSDTAVSLNHVTLLIFLALPLEGSSQVQKLSGSSTP
jgi:hypothetical protein